MTPHLIYCIGFAVSLEKKNQSVLILFDLFSNVIQ